MGNNGQVLLADLRLLGYTRPFTDADLDAIAHELNSMDDLRASNLLNVNEMTDDDLAGYGGAYRRPTDIEQIAAELWFVVDDGPPPCWANESGTRCTLEFSDAAAWDKHMQAVHPEDPTDSTDDRWRYHGLEALAAKHPGLEPDELRWLADAIRRAHLRTVAAAVLALTAVAAAGLVIWKRGHS